MTSGSHRLDGEQRSGAIDVALDYMSAHWRASRRGQLQIH